jgi:deoxyribodipyrimidine photo-lyase
MIESLYDLDQQIRKVNPKYSLWVTYGDELKILKKIHSKIKYEAIFVNEDYTPYSIKRDNSIKKFSHLHSIQFHSFTDILLTRTLNTKAQNGNYYHVFTQFYHKSLLIPIPKPQKNSHHNFYPLLSDFSTWRIKKIDKYLLDKNFYQLNPNLAIRGGRTFGLKTLSHIDKIKYHKTKDMVAIPTTRLSPHNKFGTLSIREVYFAFKDTKSDDLCRQLYWRDFYYYVGIHFRKEFYHWEHVTKINLMKVPWDHNHAYLVAWQNGLTGFPIVDAGMTELNTTGFMHNRARLIVASFLTKDLLINWKHGEQYFSQKLIDIDRAQNMGNWNWSASFGLDSTPFLRILNPHTQSSKYDPECLYIKKWLPILSDVKSNHLHQWNKFYYLYPNIVYPKPIVDHSIQRKLFIKYYHANFK